MSFFLRECFKSMIDFGSERSNEKMKGALNFDTVKPSTVIIEQGNCNKDISTAVISGNVRVFKRADDILPKKDAFRNIE